MPCRVGDGKGFHRVEVWGETSKWELLGAIQELRRRDPLKQKPDLWIMGKGISVPFDAFGLMTDTVLKVCPANGRPARTAIAVADGLQLAQAELYRVEASRLPFEIRVFISP